MLFPGFFSVYQAAVKIVSRRLAKSLKNVFLLLLNTLFYHIILFSYNGCGCALFRYYARKGRKIMEVLYENLLNLISKSAVFSEYFLCRLTHVRPDPDGNAAAC